MKDRIVIRGGQVEHWLDNRLVTEEEYRAVYPLPSLDGPVAELPTNTWPIVSDAMAVHPKQRDEAARLAESVGVPTEFTRKGQPIFTSAAHRKAFCRAHGVHDNNGGYGDP